MSENSIEQVAQQILGSNVFCQDYNYGRSVRISSTDATITPLDVAAFIARYPGADVQWIDADERQPNAGFVIIVPLS